MQPSDFRQQVRQNLYQKPTAGICPGYAQANLIVLPVDDARDFEELARKNSQAIPLLEVGEVGSPYLKRLGKDVDLRTDIPKYRIYRKGELAEEPLAVTDYWRDDLVPFLIGCSFSFEDMLLAGGIEIRHITEKVNVPMYTTNHPLDAAGRFSGQMVVSMRPIPADQVDQAVAITSQVPDVHGAPVQIGHPEELGITDLSQPDFGQAVTIKDGEVPVFWACGVTPQAAVMASKVDFAITHAPGHMLVTDLPNTELIRAV
ncbi:putative hydro-lyase [Leuconostocaceae bacterium ESL0723]|nr:putative hydro-lyase [Leuconostocaceae bacterium ESL0723]